MNYLLLTLSLLLLHSSNAFSTESNDDKKVAIVSYMSWHLPFGTLNGCNLWKKNGILYRNFKESTYHNYPVNKLNDVVTNLDPISFANSPVGKGAIEAELEEIKQAGFDVVAYDMLPDPKPRWPTLNSPAYCNLALFDLFGELGIKKGLKLTLLSDIKNLSGDYPNAYQFNESEWTQAYSTIISRYSNKDWYWKLNGIPTVFQFGASTGAIKGKKGGEAIVSWLDLISNLNKESEKIKVFLDVRPREYEANADGFKKAGAIPFLFAPGAPYNFINNFMADLRAENDYLIWPANVNYTNKKIQVHLPPDFARIDSLYSSAISNNSKAIMFNTWNDFGEDTDAAPSKDKSMSMLALLKYYNSWFKTGKKPITNVSQIIIVLPKYRFARTNSRAPKWGGGANEGEDGNPGHIAYYWSNLKVNGWIKVGDSKINLSNGVNFGKTVINQSDVVRVDSFIGGAANINIQSFELESDRPNTPGRNYQYILITEK
ncbi:hypothetical protein [Methylophilus methylotrophus]|uniref:hypothetical protein n=1 Tax=Methylophilus methylotrophus TaxID=17 RepID=UPI000F59BA69|nr:hypothetical protein [Methylophilus methylotrophus]